MAASAGLFAYGGYLLDGLLGTAPLFLVVGAVLGFGGGFVHFLAAVAPEVLPFGRKGREPADDSGKGPTSQGPTSQEPTSEPGEGPTSQGPTTDRASEDPPAGEPR